MNLKKDKIVLDCSAPVSAKNRLFQIQNNTDYDMKMKDVSKRIKKEQKISGINKDKVIDCLGVSRSSYEHGMPNLSIKRLMKVCDFLECEPMYILGYANLSRKAYKVLRLATEKDNAFIRQFIEYYGDNKSRISELLTGKSLDEKEIYLRDEFVIFLRQYIDSMKNEASE